MTAPLDRAADALRRVFGYAGFRPGQEEIVGAVLAGEDVLAVMPTGSGKSMCFQLPPLVDHGLTLVVSPLIALMRDQVTQLHGFGVAAATLNSSQDEAAAGEVWRGLEAGTLRLLYVSPERLAISGMAERLRERGVTRLAIDEAHCVSVWGHDFRPEYRTLAAMRQRLGNPPTLALTATADEATRADIAAQLFPRRPRMVVHGFDRPNIHLRFAAKDRPRDQIERFLHRRPGEGGIVYCATRNRTETFADFLSDRGRRAVPYHAGLPADVRAANQDRFLQEDGIVVCATIAFGMGVNKPDVRFVIHADMPSTVEAYYQEIGRAGRDGLPAATLTLYGLDDFTLRRRQIAEKEMPEAHRAIEFHKLQAMIDLCESATCRRATLLGYFGEHLATCSGCDICDGSAVGLVDATVDAQKALSAIRRTGERFGAGHITDILIGRETDNIKRLGHDGLKTFGVGADRDALGWRAILRQLVGAGALQVAAGEFATLGITAKGEDILFGRERISLRPPANRAERRAERRAEKSGRAAGARPAPSSAQAEALLKLLKAKRLELARAEGVAAFMIFPDRTLIEIAERRPTDLDAFAAIHGVGQRKLVAYADAFMEVVASAMEREAG